MADWLRSSSQIARSIRSSNWIGTPLGHWRDWPAALRIALNLMFDKPEPQVLFWGPERLIFRNDAFARLTGGDVGPPARPLGEVNMFRDGGFAERVERAFAGIFVSEHGPRSDDAGSGIDPFAASFAPLRDEVGVVAGVLATWRAPRERSEMADTLEALRQSEARFAALLESIPVGVAVIDTQGRFVVANDLFRRFLPTGIIPSHDKDRGARWRAWDKAGTLVTPDRFPGIRALRGESVNPGMDLLYTDDDAQEIWTSVAAAPIRNHAGQVTGAALVINDISEQRRSALALEESEQRSAFLLKLSDQLRSLASPAEMRKVACSVLATHLGADRVYYVDYAVEDGYGVVDEDFASADLPSLSGRYPLEDFPTTYDHIAGGRTWVVRDAAREEAIARTELDYYIERDVIAWINVPLVKGGELDAILCVVQTTPRDWSGFEIALVEEVAERLCSTVRHARAEAALRESEERFRQFGEASQDVLWIRNAKTLELEYLTPAAEEIYGVSREQIQGRKDHNAWLGFVLAADHPLVEANIDRVRSGERITYEFRIRRPCDGMVRWIRNTDFPLRDAGGEVVSIGGIGHDLTELRETELRLERLIEGVPQLIWRADPTGRWTWASPQWRQYTGLTLEESLDEKWLSAVHPDDRATFESRWRRAVRDGRLEVEARIRSASTGQYRWFQTRATAVRDKAGSIIEWVGTSTDIDDLRELQARQASLVAELQHRTRNLITVVKALAGQTILNAATLSDFEARFNSRLGALSRVQGLLSSLSAGTRVTFDELLKSELKALGAPENKVLLSGPEGVQLRSAMVQTFALALHELATNALKYGALAKPEGRLEVCWSLSPEDADAGRLHITWRESGVAIDLGHANGNRRGYGRELIEEALPYQFNAQTTFEITGNGVQCSIEVPIAGPGN